MPTRTYLSFIGLFLIWTAGFAQNSNHREITMDELEMKEDPMFPKVDALVLYRDVNNRVGDYIEVYEKLKILTEEGLDYATLKIPYYNASKIWGNTFNLEGGIIQKTKLTKDMIFVEKFKYNDNYLQAKKVTFPQVKVGSVIEIHYKASRGTSANINMQYNIPIKELTIEVYNASGSSFRFLQNPRAYLPVSRNDTKSGIHIKTLNVPPLEHESYVYDMELYRARLLLKRLGSNRGPQFATWEDVSELLYKYDDFEFHVRPKGIYKEEIAEIIKNVEIPIKKAELIYNYIKKNIEWNRYFGIYPDHGSKQTFKLKKGDVPDINLLFVSMLRSIGIEAYPILASTKMNGIPLMASREAFNYTLTGANIDNKWHVFDAANPKATFDYIPEYLVNWQGMLAKDNGSFEWIDLTFPKVSVSRVMVGAKLNHDLVLSGSIKERKTGYFGIDLRYQIKDSKIEKDSLLEVNIEGLQYKNIDMKVDSITANANISYDFSLEDAAEKIGEDLYLSPLFFLSISENPFKKSVRKFPIDFGYPFIRQHIFTVELPIGYTPTFIPDPINLRMPDNLGSYTYAISHSGNKLQVSTKFHINHSIINSLYFEELKEFFKIRVAKENEKVIMKRTE